MQLSHTYTHISTSPPDFPTIWTTKLHWAEFPVLQSKRSFLTWEMCYVPNTSSEPLLYCSSFILYSFNLSKNNFWSKMSCFKNSYFTISVTVALHFIPWSKRRRKEILKKPCSLLTGAQIHPVNKNPETAFRGYRNISVWANMTC